MSIVVSELLLTGIVNTLCSRCSISFEQHQGENILSSAIGLMLSEQSRLICVLIECSIIFKSSHTLNHIQTVFFYKVCNLIMEGVHD
jgi:hypothetical protein